MAFIGDRISAFTCCNSIKKFENKKPILALSPQSLTRDGSSDHSRIRACLLICCCCFSFKLEQAHKLDPLFFAGVHPWCPSGIRALVSHSWAALFKQRHIPSAFDSHPVLLYMLTFTCVLCLLCLVKGPYSITVALVFKRAPRCYCLYCSSAVLFYVNYVPSV